VAAGGADGRPAGHCSCAGSWRLGRAHGRQPTAMHYTTPHSLIPDTCRAARLLSPPVPSLPTRSLFPRPAPLSHPHQLDPALYRSSFAWASPLPRWGPLSEHLPKKRKRYRERPRNTRYFDRARAACCGVSRGQPGTAPGGRAQPARASLASPHAGLQGWSHICYGREGCSRRRRGPAWACRVAGGQTAARTRTHLSWPRCCAQAHATRTLGRPAAVAPCNPLRDSGPRPACWPSRHAVPASRAARVCRANRRRAP
jgi:hypothetical protein